VTKVVGVFVRFRAASPGSDSIRHHPELIPSFDKKSQIDSSPKHYSMARIACSLLL
jgi:hypothetical protein